MKIPEDLTKEQLIRDLIGLREQINERERLEEDKNRYLEELNRTKAMYQGLFEFAPDAILIVDGEGHIVQANRQVERMFGYTRGELMSVEHDILLPERLRERHREHRRLYRAEPCVRPMGTGLELYGRRKDGSELPVDISLGPMRIENDTVVLAVVRDVTERKNAEETIERLNKNLEHKVFQLEASNKDWEMFSHSVSHELRSPLFTIDGFSRTLLKKYGDKLDVKGQEQLTTIMEAVKQMRQLLDDLLVFSRASAVEIAAIPDKVDMEKIVKHAYEELKPLVGSRNVQLEMKSLPVCHGDSSLLRQVFVNFLENAIKFTEQKEVALLEVGSIENGDEIEFYVKDNGVGFDMEHKDKLFNIFQRLHSSDDFAGTGSGLAIVRRIVEKHGGRVWAEGKLGEGATFYFTLLSNKCYLP